jgi:predicted nuclease of predicted toxin-antitoxin system
MDEHVPRAVTSGLRRRGVDVLVTKEAGLLEATDREHLALAAREVRVLFTQDADFLRLHTAGVPHCGIVYAAQHTPVGVIVRGLMLIHDVLLPEDMLNSVEFL